jgi:hypothetical protein
MIKYILKYFKMYVFRTDDYRYLTKDNNLSYNINDAFLLNREYVGFRIVRFKFGDKYLASNFDIYFTEDKGDDATLFLEYSEKFDKRYVSIRKEVISLSSKPNEAISTISNLEEYEFTRYSTDLFLESFEDIKLSIERSKETKEEREKREEKEMEERINRRIKYNLEMDKKEKREELLKEINEIFKEDIEIFGREN